MTLVSRARVAGTVAALVSGAPSTAWALASGGDPLAASRAAGTLWPGRRDEPGLVRGIVVHLGISTAWTTVLALAARRGPMTSSRGARAGLAIAALDLGVVAPRRAPHVAALPTLPQVVDHALFGAVVGAILDPRVRSRPYITRDTRRRRGDGSQVGGEVGVRR